MIQDGGAQGGNAFAGQGGGGDARRHSSCRAALGWTAEGGCAYVGAAWTGETPVPTRTEQVGLVFYYYRWAGFYLISNSWSSSYRGWFCR